MSVVQATQSVAFCFSNPSWLIQTGREFSKISPTIFRATAASCSFQSDYFERQSSSSYNPCWNMQRIRENPLKEVIWKWGSGRPIRWIGGWGERRSWLLPCDTHHSHEPLASCFPCVSLPMPSLTPIFCQREPRTKISPPPSETTVFSSFIYPRIL